MGITQRTFKGAALQAVPFSPSLSPTKPQDMGAHPQPRALCGAPHSSQNWLFPALLPISLGTFSPSPTFILGRTLKSSTFSYVTLCNKPKEKFPSSLVPSHVFRYLSHICNFYLLPFSHPLHHPCINQHGHKLKTAQRKQQ